MTDPIENLKKEFENYIVPPSWKDRVWEIEDFRKFREDILKDRESLEKWWEKWANEIFWFKKWDKVLDDSNPPFYRWFIGGETNLAYLCADWQIEQGRKNKVAIIWEGEPVDEKGEPLEVRKITYYDLYRESNRIAYMLKEKLGVKKDEILTFYMPMIPELPFYMLAVQRLGAKHSIVFSGFSAEALAIRIMDAGARIVVTSDGVYRRGKVVPLKPIVDEAVKICEREGHKVEKVIVVKRAGNEISWYEDRDVWHDELLEDISGNVEVECVPLGSEDFSFILYTSGTTGRPKGAQHSVGGYAVHLYATMKMIWDIQDDDIYWCTADIGWITGHSYIVYGPLMTGATSIMYEGAPNYPDIGRWAAMIERYGVTIFYTAPTAIRMLMREPEETFTKYDLSTLRIVNSVGEPINPEAWNWYYKVFGHNDAVVTSTWWMTETGGIITGHFPGLGKITPLKPGTNGFPIPGINVAVFDDDGNPVEPGKRGYYVITNPWPGMLMTLFKDPERYIDVYFGKYKSKGWYYYTGDFAMLDPDGYVWVLGRADDILKVAGHRIGTAEVESALVSHSAVAEAACVGKSDEIKGEVPLIYVVLKKGYEPSDEMVSELKKHLRSTMGPVVASDALITFVDTLPKTRSGKIMRRLLRAVAEGKDLGDITTLESDVAVEEAKKAYEIVKKALES
ncbi:acetate--CoA ligase [Geoglobus acetivorans]|uniref:Acetate--CoA ligase n=1 Tax=Geoglobus acetivorans TaxID=565033 RepID=A0ABZ3H7M0_GEOAI|nr:acetate--CoA ligase [Geoglobus acetivorans]